MATVQFILPHALAAKAASIRVLGETSDGSGQPFQGYHMDRYLRANTGSLTLTYPAGLELAHEEILATCVCENVHKQPSDSAREPPAVDVNVRCHRYFYEIYK